MNKEIEALIAAMEAEDAACVISKDTKTWVLHEKGIRPLLQYLEEYGTFQECRIVDRVIGKAAAYLMIYGGAKEVYTNVLSEPAAEVFQQAEIPYSCRELVPYIVNRTKDGRCPMETAVLKVNDPKEAFFILKEKVTNM